MTGGHNEAKTLSLTTRVVRAQEGGDGLPAKPIKPAWGKPAAAATAPVPVAATVHWPTLGDAKSEPKKKSAAEEAEALAAATAAASAVKARDTRNAALRGARLAARFVRCVVP